MHVHKGTRMQICTQIHTICAQVHTCENTEKANIKKRPNYFLLFLPLSVSFSHIPVAFNLAFIASHSQYHPQSVSTLQHSPYVSHLSLSQQLTLSSPLSDTQTEKQKAKFGALRLNPVSRTLKCYLRHFQFPSSPRTTAEYLSGVRCRISPQWD